MGILGLLGCVVLILALGMIAGFPYPARETRSPIPANLANYPYSSPAIRRARAAEEPKKEDLEGSESAFVSYPYWGWPYYGYYAAPQVIYVG